MALVYVSVLCCCCCFDYFLRKGEKRDGANSSGAPSKCGPRSNGGVVGKLSTSPHSLSVPGNEPSESDVYAERGT